MLFPVAYAEILVSTKWVFRFGCLSNCQLIALGSISFQLSLVNKRGSNIFGR